MRAVLPVLARPEARHMLMVGLGAGTALEAVPSTLEDIDVIEIEPRVITANEVFRSRRAVDPPAAAHATFGRPRRRLGQGSVCRPVRERRESAGAV